ncbi:MAG: radical SAM protein [Theionarchaea archaeon]|nr:radical SAM protein [Theionarchaea archaeon]MBU7001328.1 radical SAM protein [Theionarchaea archaeon]MBU7019819.1 radical SAM protein [Theionarchaea archaeon]MBU7035142.1 radical SAM protein [Theionarchaea archaeon]MBU7040757.1 radical SAM protein [Theionarchaea archaeon]
MTPLRRENSGKRMRAPLTVYLEVTRKCNLHCAHCLVRNENVSLDVEVAKRILDELVEERVFKIYFTGGEPLLYSGLEELLIHLRGRPVWSLVQTNGLLLTESRAKALREAHLGALDLPLFGITSDTHDAITGIPGSFDTLLDTLAMLRDLEIRAFVSFMPMSHNIHQAPSFPEWAHEQGLVLAHIRRYIPRKENDEHLPDPTILNPIIIGYARNRSQYDKKGLHYEIEEAFDFSEQAGRRCPAGVQVCSITAEGNITPCPYITIQDESVAKEGFKCMWETSSLLQRARDAVITGGKCATCTYVTECGGGCIAAAHMVRGAFEEPDPYCLYHPDTL